MAPDWLKEDLAILDTPGIIHCALNHSHCHLSAKGASAARRSVLHTK